ncbi:hypothetical protein [Streptomyces sp. NPDC059262]|uniref:hypothetical protein n=1 Tax=Streptomyces sp. NPDC059262 TaxID=3346797 RepID=UPI003693A737
MSGCALGGVLASACIVLQASTVEDTAVCVAARILGPTDETVGAVSVTGPVHGSSAPGISLSCGRLSVGDLRDAQPPRGTAHALTPREPSGKRRRATSW